MEIDSDNEKSNIEAMPPSALAGIFDDEFEKPSSAKPLSLGDITNNSSRLIPADGSDDETPSSLNTSDYPHSVEVFKDKLTAKYIGKGNHAHDVGSVRANNPVPSGTEIYYYEVLIKDSGFKGTITIGFSNPQFNMSRQIGTTATSFGYRGDDGRKFNGGSRGHLYGPVFTTEDVVGCGFNMFTNEIFYTKNGRYLGPAFSGVSGKLFPTVSLHSTGEVVQLNFGEQPFKFDLENLKVEEKEKIELLISSTTIDKTASISLIQAYLLHYGYSDTLEILERSYNFPRLHTHSKLYSTLAQRKKIRQLVVSGAIDEAISEVEKLCPKMLNSKKDILFHLHCQQFIQLISQRKLDEAVRFAQKVLSGYARTSDIASLALNEVMGLLAYEDVAKSPVAYLLKREHHEEIADILNTAINEYHKLPAQSTMEMVLRHLLATQFVLREQSQKISKP